MSNSCLGPARWPALIVRRTVQSLQRGAITLGRCKPQVQSRWRNLQCRAQQPGDVDFNTSPGRSGTTSFNVGSAKAREGKLGRLQQQLKALGLAGVLAYGLFNTLYYTGAFLIIWVYVAKVPAGLGAPAAARRFLEVFALTWAGSQVTKAPRAAGALLLAPLVDCGMSMLERRLKLRSRQQAFLVVLGCCLAFALVLFCGVVLAWA